jgi:hypothetical protein
MVLAFWILGDKWYDSTPLGWYLAQYIDGRGAKFDAGVKELLATLTNDID